MLKIFSRDGLCIVGFSFIINELATVVSFFVFNALMLIFEQAVG